MLKEIKNFSFYKRANILVLGCAISLLSACGGGGSSNNDDDDEIAAANITVVSNLSGSQRVPAIDTNATGISSLTLNPNTGELTGSVTTSNLSGPITAAHLHLGFAGIEGPVLIGFEQSVDNANIYNIPSESILTADQMSSFLIAQTYVNVHTTNNPSGEIRGQVLPENFRVVRTELEGAQENPPVTSAGSATAFATINDSDLSIVANIRSSNIDDATVAHIHSGFAGLNGAVSLGLDQDVADPALWTTPENSTLTEEQLAQLNAGGTYYNLHTPANPAGELRGQILPEGVSLLRTELEGQQQNPPVVSAGSALAYSTINTETGAIVANLRSTNLEDATVAHIHNGFAGTNGPVFLGLEQNADDLSLWASPAGATLSAEELEFINTGASYFNLHTPANPSGEVRGQIIPANISLLRTELEGQQQNPPVASTGSALAYSTVNTETGAIVANLRSTNLEDATVAHIHNGFAGTNGPVFLGLEQNADDLSLWASPAGATLSAEELEFINTGASYFNLHTPANPSGEVRGQIIPQDIVLARTELEGAQQNPPVVSTGSAIAYATVNTSSGSVVGNVTSTNLDDATVLHIHTAEIGANGPVAVGLEQSATDVTQWSTAADASFTEEQLALFLNDGTYFNLHTPANPAGEVRGQNNVSASAINSAASIQASQNVDEDEASEVEETEDTSESEQIPSPAYSY